MYQDPQKYPFLKPLEDNWETILAEYRGVAENPEMHLWPEKQLFDGRWDTFGLYAFGNKQHDNCKRCPVTTKLVEQIPGMVMAGFSRLAGGTHIKPHVGYGGWSQYVMRCHLGLIVPEGCEMRVGPETRSWKNGKVTVFCDATEHEVWNRAATERVVLLLDFRNPEFRWKVLNPEITPEMQEFIRDRWAKLTVKEKLGFVAWRAMNFWKKPRRYHDEVGPAAKSEDKKTVAS
jgi:aspartyl/asparaginyl beta-hydroxylase (cupin superfamily)